MSDNNRQFPRKEIQIEVELSFHKDSSCNVITQDMSQGGMLMRLNDTGHYPLGEMVNLRFKDPFADFAPTEKDAIIVRHTDNGIAVAYIEIDEF